jgi:tetratricopeptide (TPR) repeat protein
MKRIIDKTQKARAKCSRAVRNVPLCHTLGLQLQLIHTQLGVFERRGIQRSAAAKKGLFDAICDADKLAVKYGMEEFVTFKERANRRQETEDDWKRRLLQGSASEEDKEVADVFEAVSDELSAALSKFQNDEGGEDEHEEGVQFDDDDEESEGNGGYDEDEFDSFEDDGDDGERRSRVGSAAGVGVGKGKRSTATVSFEEHKHRPWSTLGARPDDPMEVLPSESNPQESIRAAPVSLKHMIGSLRETAANLKAWRGSEGTKIHSVGKVVERVREGLSRQSTETWMWLDPTDDLFGGGGQETVGDLGLVEDRDALFADFGDVLLSRADEEGKIRGRDGDGDGDDGGIELTNEGFSRPISSIGGDVASDMSVEDMRWMEAENFMARKEWEEAIHAWKRILFLDLDGEGVEDGDSLQKSSSPSSPSKRKPHTEWLHRQPKALQADLWEKFALCLQRVKKRLEQAVVASCTAMTLVQDLIDEKKRSKDAFDERQRQRDILRYQKWYSRLLQFRGALYTRSKKWGLAILDLTSAIDADPVGASLYLERGKLWIKNDRIESAIRDFSTCLKLDSTCFRARFHRARAYLMDKDVDRAFRDFDALLDDSNVVVNRGEIFFMRGCSLIVKQDYRKAVEEFTHAIEESPRNGTYYFNRGNALVDLGEHDLALHDFTAVMELDSSLQLVAKLNRANCYSSIGMTRKALKDYDGVVLNAEAYLLGEALYSRGMLRWKVFDFEEAMTDMTESIRVARKFQFRPFYLLYYERGFICFDKGNIRSALADFTRSIESCRDKSFVLPYLMRGFGLLHSGMLESAEEDASVVCLRDPSLAQGKDLRNAIAMEIAIRKEIEEQQQQAQT